MYDVIADVEVGSVHVSVVDSDGIVNTGEPGADGVVIVADSGLAGLVPTLLIALTLYL